MNLNSRPPAIRRYAAAALAAGLVFGISELASRWLHGGGADNLHNPAGLAATWIAARFTPAPSLLTAGSERAELAHLLFMCMQGLLVGAFLVLLARTVLQPLRAPRLTALCLACQLVLGVALDSLVFSLLATVQLAAVLPLARGLRWLGMQFVLGAALDVFLVLQRSVDLSDTRIQSMLAVMTFERCLLPLAFSLVWLVRNDRAARLRLAQAHAQLQATQMLLGDTVRASERMRIARDLHDSLGHHLTALNLHLDLALRQAAGAAPASLHTSRKLAQNLLTEVRSVVGAERDERRIDVEAALRLLCSGIPSPAIALDIGAHVGDCSPATAHALFCCVQEALTNTVRHANASRLEINIARDGDRIAATILDNGHGSAQPEGNGLTGMRERVTELGGTLHAGSARGQGFQVTLTLPAVLVAA
jgi:two-component system sensor histidine kinase DesK